VSLIFDIASDRIPKDTIDWINDADIRMLLTSGAGVPIKANATVLAALAESNVDEIAAVTGYSRETMTAKAITTTASKTMFDGDDVEFGALGGASNATITGAIIYKGTLLAADDATNIPIMYVRFDTSLLTNGGTVTISKNTVNKWFYLDNTA
jgi:hypothetical protein